MKKNEKNNTQNKPSVIRNIFVPKMHELWRDRRPFSVRLIMSLLCAFACSFTFVFFGPLEIYLQNMQFLNFSFTTLLKAMAILCVAVFVVLSLILLVLRGKIFNYALTLLFSITVCGYIQRNILNADLGALDGTAIPWNTMALPMMINILIWTGIIVLVFSILYFSRKGWAFVIRMVCALLICAQSVALFSILTTKANFQDDTIYISSEGVYNVTTGNNVVFFLLDRMDEKYISEIVNNNPDWKTKELADFTYYDNFTGSYTRTMPSVAYLLTGVQCKYDIPFDDYFKKAWTTSSFLSDIREAGYKTRVYSDLSYVFGAAKNVEGKIDNMGTNRGSTNYLQLYKNMLDLSAFSYAPNALKPYFWVYTGDVSSVNDAEYAINDGKFWQAYRDNGGIDIEEAKGQFIFYHLNGCHDPHTLDEFGNYKDPTSWREQLTGDMRMIFNYIEELKANGLYDNTTIIISADHGQTGSLAELDHERLLGLLIKPANAGDNQEMKVSSKQICQDNLRASIISYFGLPTDDYGRTIESIGEDEEMVRYFWMQAGKPDERDIFTITYKIVGDAKDFKNWSIVDKEEIKYPFYDTSKTQGL